METPLPTSPRSFDWTVPKIVDRGIGLVAFSPFAYTLWKVAHETPVSFENLLLLLELSILAVTMVTRHPPTRVTRNPWFWALAFVATYWGTLTSHIYDKGERLLPVWITLSISVLSFILAIWARLSLGRNIGFVPAERRIVSTGTYAYIRHPIYTSIFLGMLALDLADFSWRNVALDVVWLVLWIVKSRVEEFFLSASPEYAAYTKRVRWRWIPGVV
jgi:protein-S-isoprenylcysteine O-methyltransferase Ste14